MPELPERFFIPTPISTSQTQSDGSNKFAVYLNEQGQRLLWSGDLPLPAIGSRVFITMNNIGWALVKGYFESYGYLGVMTLAIDPPAWLRQQQMDTSKEPDAPRWAREGVGCEYGSELSLQAPVPTVVSTSK